MLQHSHCVSFPRFQDWSAINDSALWWKPQKYKRSGSPQLGAQQFLLTFVLSYSRQYVSSHSSLSKVWSTVEKSFVTQGSTYDVRPSYMDLRGAYWTEERKCLQYRDYNADSKGRDSINLIPYIESLLWRVIKPVLYHYPPLTRLFKTHRNGARHSLVISQSRSKFPYLAILTPESPDYRKSI